MPFVAKLFDPDDDRPRRRPTLTVREVVECYIRHHATMFAERSQRERERVLLLFSERYGSQTCRDSCSADLEDFLAANPQWASNWTRKRIAASVQACFNWASRGHRIRRNPFSGVSIRAGKRGRPMTEDEFRLLLKASDACFRRVLVGLKFSGMRPGELRAIQWVNVDLAQGIIVLTDHKTVTTTRAPRPRVIVLHPILIKLLSWLKARSTSDWAFVNGQGSPWTRSAIDLRMWRLRRRLGLPDDCKLHSLRHQWASRAALAGVSTSVLAALLGHTSERMAAYYVNIVGQTERLREAVEKAMSGRVRER